MEIACEVISTAINTILSSKYSKCVLVKRLTTSLPLPLHPPNPLSKDPEKQERLWSLHRRGRRRRICSRARRSVRPADPQDRRGLAETSRWGCRASGFLETSGAAGAQIGRPVLGPPIAPLQPDASHPPLGPSRTDTPRARAPPPAPPLVERRFLTLGPSEPRPLRGVEPRPPPPPQARAPPLSTADSLCSRANTPRSWEALTQRNGTGPWRPHPHPTLPAELEVGARGGERCDRDRPALLLFKNIPLLLPSQPGVHGSCFRTVIPNTQP